MKKILSLALCCLASLAFLAGGAWGTNFCVSDAAGLQGALNTAVGNSVDDTIKVVRGTYTGHFTYSSAQGYHIVLEGGYTAGCASRVLNPANTVLDGGGTTGRVLYLYNSSGGNVMVDGFTIRNGSVTGATEDGGGVYAYSFSESGTAGTVTITHNIIRQNSASRHGGGVFALSQSTSATAGAVFASDNTIQGNTGTTGSGGGISAASFSASGTANTVTVVNNIVTGNTGKYGGGVYASSYSNSGTSGTATLTNNTVTNNTATSGDDSVPDGGGVWVAYGSSGIVNVYNNIIWGNTAQDGGDIALYLQGVGVANGYNNDYTNMTVYPITVNWDSSGDNIDADPIFVGGGDFHLRSSSPCLDRGLNSAPGIPATDFEGDARIIDGDNNGTATVDMGADEVASLGYVILHKDGAIYDSATGWLVTTPPYYPGTTWAVDMKLSGSGYVILHKDGAIWSTSAGWVMTTPPYYAGSNYARALQLVGSNGTYVILHKDGALYNSATGWITTTPPYYPGTAYAVGLEVR
jgi:hypothetical protein